MVGGASSADFSRRPPRRENGDALPNARAIIAWAIAIASAAGVTYGLDVLEAPDWLIGTGGAGTLLGVVLLAQRQKWISV